MNWGDAKKAIDQAIAYGETIGDHTFTLDDAFLTTQQLKELAEEIGLLVVFSSVN